MLGIDAIAMNMKEKKLTVIGTVDPVSVVSKLRKYWQTDIVEVGPVKEPEKKEDAKKGEAKKEGEKKEEQKKEGEKKEEGKKDEKKEDEKKKEPLPDPVLEWVKAQRAAYNPYMTTHYYAPSIEENPNACVICWKKGKFGCNLIGGFGVALLLELEIFIWSNFNSDRISNIRNT